MGLKDGEVTSCQRVLYFTLTGLKPDSTELVVKEVQLKFKELLIFALLQ